MGLGLPRRDSGAGTHIAGVGNAVDNSAVLADAAHFDFGWLAPALNPAIVVLREGVEAVLILAALTAGFSRGWGKRLRLALWAGVAAAGVASLATWAAAGSLLSSLHFLGLALDALVSVVSVVILLVITNWFFHRIYWTGWVAGFPARERRWLDAEPGQLAGMAVLGFTSTYREGFETVLFLHTLGLQTSGAAVGAGAAIGLGAVALAGALVLGLQLRLPYKRMLMATGLLISLVLVVMVGNTVHVVQLLRWMPAHMLPVAAPSWLGPWLGIHGTIEGVVAQVGAAAVVFGSYWLAERRQHGATA